MILKKRIYLAGAVSGLVREKCFEKFRIAEELLQARGYTVVNPMLIVKSGCEWGKAMRSCIEALISCDEIYMLEDWLMSKGALLEYDIARAIGMRIHLEGLKVNRN